MTITTDFISYIRVSTKRQGQSGLGLEAQQATVAAYVGPNQSIAEYREVESGRKNDRPQLRLALDHCRRTGATLIIARIDRLARNARFLLEILDAGVPLVFCDLPQVSGPQGRFMLTALAGVAELESGLISDRTRKALAAAKARGVRLGGPNGAAPLRAYIAQHGNSRGVQGAVKAANDKAEPYRTVVEGLVSHGLGNTEIAETLNGRGEKSVAGGVFTATSIRRLRARLAA